MPRTKKTGLELKADHKEGNIAKALGITEKREKELHKFAHEAFDMDKKTEGMQYMANLAKDINEYAYMAYHHGQLYGKLQVEVVRREMDDMLGKLFGTRKSIDWSNKLFGIGMGLWIVYTLILIFEHVLA